MACRRPSLAATLLFCVGVLLFAGCLDDGPTESISDTLAAVPVAGRSAEAAPLVDHAPFPGDLVQPTDLTYLGAFRLPEGSGRSNWEYSGYAMSYFPGGDPSGSGDGYLVWSC